MLVQARLNPQRLPVFVIEPVAVQSCFYFGREWHVIKTH